MNEKLLKLYNYLVNNGYAKDADRVGDIIKEYDNEKKLSDISKKKLTAMCNPRYFGNLYISEFENTYEWWNFLSEIVSNIETGASN